MKAVTPLTLAAGLLCAAASPSSLAFQPLITDDTGTQGTGGNQIEVAVNRDRMESGGLSNTIRTLPITYTRGLTDALDVFVSANHIHIDSDVPEDDASGSGNSSVGFKWRLYENEDSKTSLGLRPELRFPVSTANEAKGLGTGRTSYCATLILTQETRFGAVHANLAAGHNRFRDTPTNPDATITRLSVAPVWDVSEHWKLAFDLGTENEKADGNDIRSNFLEIGAIYSPSKDLDFALGFIHKTGNDTPKTTTNSVTTGITWRFK